MDDTHKDGLYRWTRQTNQKVYSRSQRVTSSDDIHNWIKKVEEATNKATDAAFGLVPSGKKAGKAAVELRTGLVRNHEEAYFEAQQLLTQWVNDKVRLDVEEGNDNLELWRRTRETRHKDTGLTKQKEDLGNHSASGNRENNLQEKFTNLGLEDDIDIDETAIYERVKRNAIGDTDPYADLYNLDDQEAVDIVLQNMLSKEVVKETFKKDLGFNDKLNTPDPRTKMELRHNMVKENRVKRQKEEERKKTEAQIKKEARLKAQQLILKEQKDREARTRKEEMALKKEMIHIRKEMHEERTRRAEEMKRAREQKELMEKLAKEELDRQLASEDQEVIHVQRIASEQRKQQMIRIEMVKARIASQNLQCLHKHLTAWYDLVLSKRLLMGKVKAMSDWKLMLKVWGAWRLHVKSLKLELETEIHERNVIDAERKKLAAERHYTHAVLSRSFLAWKHFVGELIMKKELEKEQERTKNKMASLLMAVAEGKLWQDDKGERQTNKVPPGKSGSSARTAQSPCSQEVEQMFQQSGRKKAWVDDDSIPSSRSEMFVNSDVCLPGSQSSGPPKKRGNSFPNHQGSQQTHSETEVINLQEVKADLSTAHQKHSDLEIRRKFGTQPWMNRNFTVNNMEHRYTAQQQTLKEQQLQIREQKRLIEELQYEQRQQMLRQQILLGSDRNLPPLPPEVEAPLPGKQLPRDKGELSDQGAVTPNTTGVNHAKKIPDSERTSHEPDDGREDYVNKINEVDTERSQLKTSRTNQSTTTCLTTFSSGAKTCSSRYVKVLRNMEDRAAERAKLKAEREERRRRLEQEKLAQLLLHEEETKRAIEAEKRTRIEAYRQKKLLEKQKEDEKHRELLHLEEMNKRADEHYQRSILKYRCLLPFKKIISLSKKNWSIAVKHRNKELLRQCLVVWKMFTEEEIARKGNLADQMHEYLVIKHCFRRWRNYKHHMKFMEQKACRHCQDTLKSRFFSAWVIWTGQEKQQTELRMCAARAHYLQSLLKTTFLAWRFLPQKLKREEEKQKRKTELRQRVAELIPDYSPHETVVVKGSEELS